MSDLFYLKRKMIFFKFIADASSQSALFKFPIVVLVELVFSNDKKRISSNVYIFLIFNKSKIN